MNYLLDVNTRLAAIWSHHEHHEKVRRWFARIDGVATCPLSQLGFARVSSHSHLGYCIESEQAFSALRTFLSDPSHLFIHDDVSVSDRIPRSDLITGPAQTTDHYLAALARPHALTVATLDEPLARALPNEPQLIALIR
jgi:toxin-antitoxin system PIN domain toxin